MNKATLITILCLILYCNAFATRYYVSLAGSDAANGTSTSTPWKSTTKVNAVTLLPGDIVSFNGGDVFYGKLFIRNSGTAGNPIIFNSYGTGQATITGFTPATGFTSVGTNLWESAAIPGGLSTTCNMVTIGGINYAMGRYPNSGYLLYESFSGNTTITDAQLTASPNWTGAELVVRKNNYVTDRAPITAHSGGTLSYTSPSATVGINGYGYFIQKDVRTLDTQNEWYYNPSTKKIRIYSASSPANVQVSTLDTLVYNLIKNYITVDGLNITGANKYAFTVASAKGVTIQNCNIDFTGENAVWGGQNWGLKDSFFVFQNNTVNHTNNIAINLESEFVGAYIGHNSFLNTGMQVGMSGTGCCNSGTSIGIVIHNQNTIVEYNIIDGVGYNGISVGGGGINCSGVIIRNNLVKNFCDNKIDGAGIYFFIGASGTPAIGQKIYSNIVINGIGSSIGTVPANDPPVVHGIYMDEGCGGVEIYNNTCAGNSYSGLFFHSSYNCNMHHNTLYNNGEFQYLNAAYNNSGFPERTTTYKNNIAFSRTATQKVASYESGFNDINLFGTIDSNYYARPIDDNITMQTIINVYAPPAIGTPRSLAMWKTYMPAYDIHSAKSPVAITNVNQLFFYYNATDHDSTVSVVSGVDVRNVAYSGTTVLSAFTSLILINTGTQTTPVISWNNPAAITYGTALSGTQLNATANTPGTFVYSPALGTTLNAGTYTLSVTFTPTDIVNYTSATKTVSLVVNKATATLSYSNLTQGYSGSQLSPTVTTVPAGLGVISTTFNGIGTAPTNANSYTVVSGLNHPNYTAAPITATFTITKATAILNVSNTSAIYNGSPKPVVVTTSPAGLSGVTILYNGSPTAPTAAGTYPVVISLNHANYTATTVNVTLIIAKATPTISWSPLTPITYPTSLSGAQLNATASVSGTFTYTPASGAILNAGTQTLSLTFTPTDGSNYNTVTGVTTTIVVNKGVATINVGNLLQTYDGTGKAVSVTTSPAGLGLITVTYDGSAALPVNVGSHAVVVTLTNANYTATTVSTTLVIEAVPTGGIVITNLNRVYTGFPIPVTVTTTPAGAAYTITYDGSPTAPTLVGSYEVIATRNDGGGSDTKTLTIAKATPVVIWSNPAGINYGTVLTGAQLNASANASGTFAYTPPSGTIPNVGTQSLSVVFTPSDAANYNSVTKIVTIVVGKTLASLSLSNLLQVYDGNPKPVVVISNPVGLSGITVTYNGSTTVPTIAGSYPIVVTLVNANYQATTITGTLIIAKATPTVTWANPAQITFGTALSATQLNATASVAGTLVYTPALGFIPSAGTRILSVTLTPSNSNYNSVTKTVTIDVVGSPFLDFIISSVILKNLVPPE